MAQGELKLLGMWASPYALRVRIVLEQKGLSYEYFEEDLFNNKSELLLKHNPVYKKVPVLIHNDRGICKSSVILQYIDENWSGAGPPLLPTDPYERATVRFWAAYVDNKLLPSFIDIMKATTEETMAEKISETRAALEQLEGAFKKCSSGKNFFGGDSIGFVDVTLGCALIWFKAVENMSGAKLLDETKMPSLVEWANRFLGVDFVKPLVPSMEMVEECAKWLQANRWNVPSVK